MTAWTLNTNLFHDCLGMTAIWEIATSVEFTKTTKFNDHWTATHFTVKSSWFILNLDFSISSSALATSLENGL